MALFVSWVAATFGSMPIWQCIKARRVISRPRFWSKILWSMWAIGSWPICDVLRGLEKGPGGNGQAIGLAPTPYAMIYLARGKIRASLGMVVQAISDFSRAAELSKRMVHRPLALVHKGQIHLEKGQSVRRWPTGISRPIWLPAMPTP